MQILEHGQEHGRTLLFFPCTAEPVWAFADTIAQLSQDLQHEELLGCYPERWAQLVKDIMAGKQ